MPEDWQAKALVIKGKQSRIGFHAKAPRGKGAKKILRAFAPWRLCVKLSIRSLKTDRVYNPLHLPGCRFL
jgi:hypothetical protein